MLEAYEGAASVMTRAGYLPVMVVCEAAFSEDVLQVLLTANPDDALYNMRLCYSSMSA